MVRECVYAAAHSYWPEKVPDQDPDRVAVAPKVRELKIPTRFAARQRQQRRRSVGRQCVHEGEAVGPAPVQILNAVTKRYVES